MSRKQAIEIARQAAKENPPTYYVEPFEPHAWVVDAIMSAYADGYSDGYDKALMVEAGDETIF